MKELERLKREAEAVDDSLGPIYRYLLIHRRLGIPFEIKELWNFPAWTYLFENLMPDDKRFHQEKYMSHPRIPEGVDHYRIEELLSESEIMVEGVLVSQIEESLNFWIPRSNMTTISYHSASNSLYFGIYDVWILYYLEENIYYSMTEYEDDLLILQHPPNNFVDPEQEEEIQLRIDKAGLAIGGHKSRKTEVVNLFESGY